MRPLPEKIWVDYAEEGKSIHDIAAAHGCSYGYIQGLLSQHPCYPEVARLRRRMGPCKVNETNRKRVNQDRALALLESGGSLRDVALVFAVSPRTLRKRLVSLPRYQQIMDGRRRHHGRKADDP